MRRVGPLLALAAALAAAGCGEGSPEAPPPAPATTAGPQPPASDTTPEPPTLPAAPAPELPSPPSRAMSWAAAGAFVWHETDVDPELLGRDLRDAGFGWVAVFLHDGTADDPVESDWVTRFRRVSGLPVGGWGVLRSEPAEEAALADRLLTLYGLDFYVANAETDYEYSGANGMDPARFERSRAFTTAFRAIRPGFPAALSSYCRPDMHDLDWAAWHAAGFVFLPQAYVNDFGADAAPAACVRAAAPVFGAGNVHPTIGMYPGARHPLTGAGYARLLRRAGTVGFSVYLAETRMDDREWQSLGAAIDALGIAR